MLCPDLRDVRVYLHREPVDMRRQRNGLAALVRAVINQDPFGNALFCFIGKGRDKLKILYWNRNGFVVWYKAIEGKEKFYWPRRSEEAVVTLTGEQLGWLLEGYDIAKMKPHRALEFAHAC
jgi:transposase